MKVLQCSSMAMVAAGTRQASREGQGRPTHRDPGRGKSYDWQHCAQAESQHLISGYRPWCEDIVASHESSWRAVHHQSCH